MSDAVIRPFPAPKRPEQLSEIYQPIRSRLNEVRERIVFLAENDLAPLHDGLKLITEQSGKLLRPALVLFSHQAVGGTHPEAVELASAVEMIHLASLFHDDVLDHAERRRGHPTLNAAWGNKLSVLAGDYVYTSAVLRLERRFPREILEPIVEAVHRMTMGEILQNVMVHKGPMTREIYFSIIEKKTAALTAACTRSGALLGGEGEDWAPFLERYGWHLGMAFQIVDDLLDWTGDPALLGKDRSVDLREGKATLPLLLLAEKRGRREGSEESPHELCALLKKEEILSRTKAVAVEHVAKAKGELAPLPETSARQALERLADFVVDRTA